MAHDTRDDDERRQEPDDSDAGYRDSLEHDAYERANDERADTDEEQPSDA